MLSLFLFFVVVVFVLVVVVIVITRILPGECGLIVSYVDHYVHTYSNELPCIVVVVVVILSDVMVVVVIVLVVVNLSVNCNHGMR